MTQGSDGVWRSRRCEVASTRARTGWLIAIVVFLLLFGWQVPGCVMAYMSKTGRVVDAATGVGLAHVAVIASAHFRADNLMHGTNSSCRYRVVVQTDVDRAYPLRAPDLTPSAAASGP
jgi:hypothetical protein